MVSVYNISINKEKVIEIEYLQLMNDLSRIVHEWNQLNRKVLRSYDLTYPQFKVLNGLMTLGTEKRIAQAQLAKHIHMDNMTLSTVIRNLETRRLVRRAESRSDTRAKNIYLTSYGLDIVEEVLPVLEYTAEEFILSKPFEDDVLKKLLNLHDFNGNG